MSDGAQQPQDLQERVLAGRLLSLGAGKSSEALDTFSGWLLTGFGAAIALIFSNLDGVLKFIAPYKLKYAVGAFLLALLLGVAQKLLASIVGASTAAASESTAIGRELSDQGIKIDFAKVFMEVERASLYPARWLVRRSLAKATNGDFAAVGRLHAVLTQVQGFLVLGVVLCCVAEALILASGLAS